MRLPIAIAVVPLLRFVVLVVVPLLVVTTTTTTTALSPSLMQQQLQLVQRAMTLTKQGATSTNITAAYAAVDTWDQALLQQKNTNNNLPQPLLPPNVRALAYALQAASLVRIGQDERALAVYDNALTLQEHLTPDVVQDIGMGRAKSLQRLLRYQQAKEQFLQQHQQQQISTSTANVCCGAVVGAATCDMRLGGNIGGAFDILETFLCENSLLATKKAANDGDDSCEEALCMRDTLYYLQHMDPTGTRKGQSFNMISTAVHVSGTVVSPLYKFLHAKWGDNASRQQLWPKNSFVDYCKMNIGAFDDPLLLYLDDKVLLHRLIMSSSSPLTRRYWPQGLILSASAQTKLEDDVPSVSDDDDDVLPWIGKRRAGYGSHGNMIVYTCLECAEALAEESGKYIHCDDSILLQRMVEPPLLLNGHKFSMRVYVVVVSRATSSSAAEPVVYIAREGLVKVAALPLEPPTSACDMTHSRHDRRDRADLRMHMTNSGRQTDMRQESFQYLRQELSPLLFDDIWTSIVVAVGNVMALYETQATNMRLQDCRNDGDDISELVANRHKLATLGFPKILGFDFVVDAACNAWLVEVNRFPGLEPRNEMDTAAKHQIVRDAWLVAAKLCEEEDIRNQNLSWLASDFVDLACIDTKNMLLRVDC